MSSAAINPKECDSGVKRCCERQAISWADLDGI